MNCLGLGYLLIFLCFFDGNIELVNARSQILKRWKSLSSLRQQYNKYGWDFLTMYGPEPEFVGDIQSIKVIAGKDAILKCVVKNLGDHKVVWRMVNNKNFLSMGAHTVEKDDRIQVTSVNSTSWYLHIKNVTQNDSGYYACQISTSPVKSQAGYLDVVEPPEFVTNMTDRNVTVMENSNVTLFCKATGNPPPVIKWKREDEQPFLVGHDLIREYESEELRLTSVSRKHMAAYLCLASNEVPPAISRRIYLDVKFGPLIWIHNQLVGAQESTNVSLECHTEAHPTSENFWLRNGEPFVSKSSRYQTHIERNSYETHMKLTIRNLQPEDYGSYQCVAKNAISETEGSIKLFKTIIPTPSPPKPVTEGMPTFPTRKVITVAVTTDHRSIFNDLERRENTNAPVKQQKYGDGRVSPDGENSVLRTDSNAVIYILVCLLSLWWGSSYKCCR